MNLLKCLPGLLIISAFLPTTRDALGAQDQASVEVWAVSDAVRVDPTCGRILIQGRSDIHSDYPNRDYRENNLIWSRQEQRVKLSAARNEFVAFQVIIEADRPLQQVDVRFPGLQTENGLSLEGKFVQLFKAWYLKVRRPSLGYEETSLGPGWYADALLPKRKASLFTGFPFSIPDLYNNISDQTNQSVWIDLFVPFDRAKAPPGQYSGELTVTWQGGERKLEVALEVWDFALPQQNNLPGDFWNNSMRRMTPEQEMAYYHIAKRHRFLPLVCAYRPELSIQNGKVEIDWSDYDARITPYMDGSAFTEKHGYWGPGYRVPIDHIMLPFNIESEKHPHGAWPIALPREGRTTEYEEVWREVGRQFREHMDSYPSWRGVRKVVFLNGLDESYFDSAYEQMLYYGNLLHTAMGPDWFLYRIDGGYSRETMDRLAVEVDLWVCHTVAFDPQTAAHFKRLGMETWFYGPMFYEQRRNSGCGSNTFLDLDLNVNRAIGWIGWKYKTGWVEWEFDWNAWAAWYEAENFKEEGRYFNGSGQLIYRGEVMNYDQPIPSIRLKSTRRGLQDFEYFWILSQRTGSHETSDRLVNEVIYQNPFGESAILDTEIWRNDPEVWDRVRIKAGELIDGQSRKPL